MSARPPTLDVLLDRIPAELQAFDQWVGWKWQLRSKKWTKPPVNVNRIPTPAAVDDPSTWAPFATVAEAYLAGELAGVGFVLTLETGITAVDLDKCRDPRTGAIKPWAWNIIERLDSYTEISPSGTGIRILARGSLPPGGRRRGLIEMYDCDRYVTLTGHHLGAVS